MDSVTLIASDMDGTLLNGKGELDPAFFPLFRELELRGIRFAAASGRQYDGLLRTFAPVADRMLFIAENGAYAAAGRKEWLLLDMDHETVAGLIAGIRCIEGTCIVLAGRDSAYIAVSYTHLDVYKRQVYGAKVGSTAFQIGAGLSVPVGTQGVIFVDGNADIRSGSSSINGSSGYRYNF